MMHRVIGVIGVVALSAWAIPVATGADLAAERASGGRGCAVFTDTFQKSKLDWFRAAGGWTVDDGKLIGKGWGGGIDAWIYVLPSHRARPPIRIDVDAEFLQGNAEIVLNSTGHWWNEYRVTVWSMESPDYPDGYQVTRYRAGESTTLVDDYPNVISPVPIPPEAHLSVIWKDNTFSLYVDGSLVDSITDPEPLPAAGTFGLGVIWDYSAAYNNFVLRTGPCALRDTRD